MAINNVADLFVATLEQAGVKRIYGIVGDSLNALTEALRRRGTIEWVSATRRSRPSPLPAKPR